jgi:hypothetical protein
MASVIGEPNIRCVGRARKCQSCRDNQAQTPYARIRGRAADTAAGIAGFLMLPL